MWKVWIKATKYGVLPSEIIDPDHAIDSLNRYVIDSAVTFFGVTIENALHETVEAGHGKDRRREQRYELSDLLDPDFRLPRPPQRAKRAPAPSGIGALLAMAGAVKQWGYVKPS